MRLRAKRFAVAERRAGHPVAQPRTERGQVRQVLREPDGPLDVIAEIRGHGLGQPDVREVAETSAGWRRSRPGRSRRVRPSRVPRRSSCPLSRGRDRGPGRSYCRRPGARAGASCRGTRAAPDRRRPRRTRRRAAAGAARCPGPEPRATTATRARGGRSRPRADDLGCDLGDIVEAAERDVSPLERGQGPDRGCLARRVEADVAVRHPQHLLAVVHLGPGGDWNAVGDQVVDRGQAGRADVADPRDLDRRGPARKDQQAVVGGVAREVEEDVDPVGADPLGERIVVQAGDFVPLARRRREPLGQVVATGPGCDSKPTRTAARSRFSRTRTRKNPTGWRRRSGETNPSRSGRSGSRSRSRRFPARAVRRGVALVPLGMGAGQFGQGHAGTYCLHISRFEWGRASPGRSSSAR